MPPKFKHKRVPRGPGTPPPPVHHSPPRKLTQKDQKDWKIPPCVSNWKNAHTRVRVRVLVCVPASAGVVVTWLTDWLPTNKLECSCVGLRHGDAPLPWRRFVRGCVRLHICSRC